MAKVDWFIKADLENGYQQLPMHPVYWHTQIYSLDHAEHYIDICMPFGLANLSTFFLSMDISVVSTF